MNNISKTKEDHYKGFNPIPSVKLVTDNRLYSNCHCDLCNSRNGLHIGKYGVN